MKSKDDKLLSRGVGASPLVLGFGDGFEVPSEFGDSCRTIFILGDGSGEGERRSPMAFRRSSFRCDSELIPRLNVRLSFLGRLLVLLNRIADEPAACRSDRFKLARGSSEEELAGCLSTVSVSMSPVLLRFENDLKS